MKLRALDQILVSSVQPDVLTPGQEFEVNDAYGADLVKRNPRSFKVMDKPASTKAEPAPKNKAEPVPKNKAAAAPHNKTAESTEGKRA